MAEARTRPPDELDLQAANGSPARVGRPVLRYGGADRTSGAQTNHPVEDIRADDEHVIWPFVGEYWRDELGYYRVKIRNKCQRNAPEGAPATGESAAGRTEPGAVAAVRK